MINYNSFKLFLGSDLPCIFFFSGFLLMLFKPASKRLFSFSARPRNVVVAFCLPIKNVWQFEQTSIATSVFFAAESIINSFLHVTQSVSYTHLTLPTICSV